MKVLVSPANLEEAKLVLESDALGDLPFKPGTASLAAYGAVSCGVDYLKVGLYDIKNYEEACEMMKAVVKSVRMLSQETIVVAAGSADFRRFDGLDYKSLVRAAKDSGSDVVMVDTAIKDGKNLFDALSVDELKEFIRLSHEAGLKVALAGSLRNNHIDIINEFKGIEHPDIVGVRGVVCENFDRTKGIQKEKITEFLQKVNEIE